VGSPDEVELLRRLVAIDTTSDRSNLPLLDLVEEVLDRPGVRRERFPSADGAKANLLVELGPEGDGGGLLLCGHTDVVPAGDGGWRADPFRLRDEGDRWVARGACDMKGFLALAVARAARLEPAALRRPLVLLLTHDEEVGTLGAQRFVRAWAGRPPLPRAAVVGEPTSLRVVRLHKGHLRLEIELRGRSAHSSLPHLGRNAIEAAGRALEALRTLHLELEREVTPGAAEAFPEAPHVTFNVGRIAGGGALNVVPEHCVIGVGLRPLPGMDGADLVERVRGAVAAALGGDGVAWSLEVLGASPALASPPDAAACRALAVRVGPPEARGASFASDAGPLQELGLQPVLFGPGSIEAAHRPNEFLPRAEFERCGEVLDGVVHDLCAR
jgi:acetylornithine deacetylase